MTPRKSRDNDITRIVLILGVKRESELDTRGFIVEVSREYKYDSCVDESAW